MCRLRSVLEVSLSCYVHRSVTFFASVVLCRTLSRKISTDLTSVDDYYIMGNRNMLSGCMWSVFNKCCRHKYQFI